MQRQPLAAAGSRVQVAWLRVQLRSRCAAHQYLQDIAAVKVAAGHSYVLLGDLNARVGSAAAADQDQPAWGAGAAQPGGPGTDQPELPQMRACSTAAPRAMTSP